MNPQAGFYLIWFIFLKCICVLRRRVKVDRTAQAECVHSCAIRKAGHHGELRSREQTCEKHHKNHWFCSVTAQRGLNCGGGWNRNPAATCTHCATPSIWEYLHVCFVVQGSKGRFIWLVFMTHFSKFER